MHKTLIALAAGALLIAPALSHAQAWPAKPIRILVGSPPGGPSDITTRVFGEQLSQRLKQPVVVENRPGVGNSLAAGVVAKGEPDGYTLVISPDTVVTVNPLVYTKLNFDARTELANVSVLAAFTQMLVCNAGKGVRTVPELVAKAKAGRMNYASGGPGVPGHLAAEMFLQTAGVKMEHVPYKGPAPATLAVLSGEVDCGFLATPTVLPHVKAGKLNALAVSSAEPSPLAPDVPTLAKALNRPDVDISFKLVLQAPKATPAPVLAELERAAMDIMKKPEVRAKLQASDLVSIGSTMKDAEGAMKAEAARWEPVVKRLDIKAE
ncbi:receptor [Ramlibacter sp. USB13]|uniref:Receptor n=1 Tax=Ramlibacter cellulosilyticus TaxID=2764187 RepID=A0A923MPA8_9BURK|nr:tripartite tricarboxylate transporter substrate-binding protein [Ramlibacter cellulosilyticus]MBC5782358.1 receptor [Ramlibacter cellulosilyticus]